MTSQINRNGFSVRRVLLAALPLVVAMGAWFGIAEQQRRSAKATYESWSSKEFGLDRPTQNRLHPSFQDKDGNLLADTPDETISPETLKFSYIPGSGREHLAETWQPFMDALAAATGRNVEFVVIESVEEQLDAIANGNLHVTCFNTGAVPTAVNACGFIPSFVLGSDDGTSGYSMQFIVPKNSPLTSVESIRGHQCTFTSIDSNSGFKAPVVTLMYDFDLKPGRDYDYAFSASHDLSIQGIAKGDLEVAAIASDMLERAIERGDVSEDSVNVIYTSERFPPAAVGCVFNLDEALRSSIEDLIRSFELPETLRSALGLKSNSKFVAAAYKDDWALVRRTDDALGIVHKPNPKANTKSEPTPEPGSVGENANREEADAKPASDDNGGGTETFEASDSVQPETGENLSNEERANDDVEPAAP